MGISGSSDAPGSSARKRSVSGKCFICAKAKRQRQMFYLCESEASATKRPVGTEINFTLVMSHFLCRGEH
ncbi:hypothetical protein ACQKNB_12365 [Lysinibacillus xylanilyticus]|uniref:hypothetical protein n=1 Tax=Lysinibacillus xylanilyticus TaxID=582475 RepID=UPI003CFF8BC5